MRAPIFSLLLLLLPPLSKASFHSSNPVATEVQKDSKLPAERFPRSTKQDCPCEDAFQIIHGGKRAWVAKSPASKCPCDHLKYKRRKTRHQKHQRQSCLRFLKQCQLRDITLPL
ncbi:C-X-C motif chemokine 17 isoform X1 [Macrotis lagotis]|uniref:C-X-C motif chemokine 17 isoform X1 n=1 Tax=Macrotis lagotis TaxID=92651 RepID=UPI003D692EB6